jgi:hypothetical protein
MARQRPIFAPAEVLLGADPAGVRGVGMNFQVRNRAS